MKRNDPAALLKALLNQINTLGDTALPAEPMPDIVKATQAPAWLTEGRKAVGKSTAKAPAESVKPRWVAIPHTYNPPKGNPIPGVKVFKMFGEEVDRRNPHGNFLTLAAAEAVFALLSREPRS